MWLVRLSKFCFELQQTCSGAKLDQSAGDKLLKQQRLLVDMLAEHSPQARFLPSEFSVDYDSGPSGCPDVYTSKIELQVKLLLHTLLCLPQLRSG